VTHSPCSTLPKSRSRSSRVNATKKFKRELLLENERNIPIRRKIYFAGKLSSSATKSKTQSWEIMRRSIPLMKNRPKNIKDFYSTHMKWKALLLLTI
jgi:hypothetical protein